MMLRFQARVQNRRLVLDEPTDLPEGMFIELVPIDEVFANEGDALNDEERAALDAELKASFAAEDASQLIDAAEALADLRSRRG
jgi:hypothetical protein